MRITNDSEPILGATLLSSCFVAGVSFHLEDGSPDCILVCFKGAFAPLRYFWPDFQKIVEKFRAGRSRVRNPDSAVPSGPLWKNSPKEKSWRVSARFLDRGEIRCQWGDSVVTLSPTDFATLVDMVITAQNKAVLLISRRRQKAELSGKPTWRNRFHMGPQAAFYALIVLDISLFLGMFVFPLLFWAFAAVSLMIGFFLIRSPNHLDSRTTPSRPHFHNYLWSELENVKIPPRLIEILGVLFLAYLYFAYFGFEAITVIMSSFKRILGVQ